MSESSLLKNTSLLLEEANKTGDIQHLLDLGFELLGNPLLLVDISLCFIAHAGGNSVCDEPLWEWTLSKGYVTEEYVNSIMMHQQDINDATPPKFIWEEGMLHHPQLVGMVNQAGIPLGYLKLLAYNHSISEEDQALLGVLCDLIAMLLSTDKNKLEMDHPLIESFITSLLKQKLYDPVAIEERAYQFNLRLYDNLVVIAVKLSNTMIESKDKAYHLKRKLQNSLNRNTMVFLDNHLVIIYDSKDPFIFNEREYNSLKTLVDTLGCTMGISTVFHSLENVPEQYANALTALNINRQLNLQESVCFYKDHIVDHMILKYTEQNDISYLIHPAVSKLLALDREKGSDYVVTLFSYINNFQNLTETSKELHIHHNTLKYRIGKIVEMTGLNLSDSETVFKLQVSDKALKVKHCRSI